MRNFRDLEVWKEAIEIVKKVYTITSSFPITEKYGLVSQMNKSAVSIPSNIAEGCSRKTSIDFARFIEIGLGSSFELETQIIIATNLDYISNEQAEIIIAELNILQKRINALREAILNPKTKD
jgi:four helix bundle protein